VLELAGVDKARALAIAKENGLLSGTLTRSPSVVQSAAEPGKPGRRRQRSLGGTRASRRYNFWQVRAQVLETDCRRIRSVMGIEKGRCQMRVARHPKMEVRIVSIVHLV
jgi:hypothetical protein